MKKKKSFWALVAAFCLIVPAMFIFTACKHKHSFEEKWSSDAVYHWHACTGKDCKEKSGKAQHDYSSATDPTCDTCGYERTFENNNVVCEDKISKTYNGREQALVQGTDFTCTNGTASVSYKVKDSDDEFTAAAPKNAGTYLVRILVPANSTYKAAYKVVEYTIEKIDVNADLENLIDPSYNGGLTHEELVFKTGDLKKDKIFIRISFPDKNVGTVSSGAELYTTNSDQTVLNNYKLDSEVCKVKRTGKNIDLGNGTKDNKFKIGDTLDSGFSLIKLDKTFFYILEGDEVYLKISRTYRWESGSKIKLVIDEKDYVPGENELVTLTGADAGNYKLYGFGTATYTKTESAFSKVAVDSPFSSYFFGTDVETIAYGNITFNVLSNAENNWTEALVLEENKNKDVEIRVSVGSVMIAKIERSCYSSNGEIQYSYLGGAFHEDGHVSFNLLSNIAGYTDEQCRWICETPSITINVQIVFADGE